MSKIEWTDRSDWNPMRGCTRVSEGCRSCYAEAIAARFSDPGQPFHGFAERTANGPRWTGKVALIEDRLTLPLKWRKPARIFVNSAFDLFHESVPDAWIDRVFAVMALAPQHTFQVLTKRSKRMREHCSDRSHMGRVAARLIEMRRDDQGNRSRLFDQAIERLHFGCPLPNVWLGVSAEDQERYDARREDLRMTPAATRFFSFEPLLGAIQGSWLGDWAIVGAESGPSARPMREEWAQSLVDQCEAARVACFVKQLPGKHGRPIKDMAAFPPGLQVRQYPEARA